MDGAEPPSGDLKAALAQFKAERPYPNDKDQWHEEQRAQFADGLSAENLAVFDLDLFPQARQRQALRQPRPPVGAQRQPRRRWTRSSWTPSRASCGRSCGAKGSRRPGSTAALDWDDLGTKGLGESVLLKLFAVTDPRRFLPVFPLDGSDGEDRHAAQARARRYPDATLSRGQQHVAANDALQRALEPLLPGDPWGQGQFAYWLLDHDATPTPPGRGPDRRGGERTAGAGGVPREIEELLKEKGQLIFYGPPGTGKTYLADRFAAALQPDPERRMLVQFHPSMSYEDFFEGYRPQIDERRADVLRAAAGSAGADGGEGRGRTGRRRTS